MAHRGPDGEGFFTGPGVALGHRRLSIIDLSDAGRQPMANEDESVWVVFNGEIYNHRELRRGLEEQGHRFRSRTDSEVLVHLYEEHREDLVTRLRGMFALAIWDVRARRLVLARDRVGKKPLSYHLAGDGTLWFASEAKALLAAGVSDELDPLAVDAYLRHQYVPSPASAFRAIRRLPAAHRMVVEQGASPRIERYWRLSYQPKREISREDAISELDAIVEKATAARLESDVPLGAFLSGGIDSSTVVAMMARAGGRVRTFCAGFETDGFDERPWARTVAEHLGTEHEELVVPPPDADALLRMVRAYDDPFADVSAIPTMLLSEATRRHVVVALTGDGGDESFAGYSHHRAVLVLSWLMRAPHALRGSMRNLLAPLLRGSVVSGTVRRRAERFVELVGMTSLEEAFSELVLDTTPEMRARLLQPPLLGAAVPDSPRVLVFADQTRGDVLDRLLASDVENYLADCLMTKTDIASMAVSLECRSPLLDHELMEFAARLPSRWKTDGVRSKRIFKDLAGRLLPPSVIGRRKAGFSMPVEGWLRRELRPLVVDLLDRPHPKIEEFVRPAVVRRLVDEHLRGLRTWRRPLWALLVLEAWLQALPGKAQHVREERRARA